MEVRIQVRLRIMGVFETPSDFKLFTGHFVHFRRNPFSSRYGPSHIQLFENNNSTEVIGHVSGELGTVGNSDSYDCDILSQLIDCHTAIDSTHHCTLSLMLVENTTHRVGGSYMVANISCKLEDLDFFVEFLNNFNKNFELV